MYISIAKTCNAAKWKNTRTTWPELVAMLRETTRTDETLEEYAGLTRDQQDKIKDVGGFVGGYLEGGTYIDKRTRKPVEVKAPFGLRRKTTVRERQVVALDVDHGQLDTWLDFRALGVTACMYSTHKHKPEAPRYRIVFPLDRPATPDEYEALARFVASWVNIEVFDDTTFQPSRLMYFPSTSSDGVWLFDEVEGEVLSVDETLESMHDWSDATTWPRSSRVAELHHNDTDKVEDPTTKPGTIGAFCRAFSVEEAIAEFLPEVYTPVEGDRFTYVGGSTSGGLVVYDGLYAYSHHATDPAGSKLCNAFDLVRLHLFGDLEEVKPGASMDGMVEFANGLPEVKRELVVARRGNAREYEDAAERAVLEDWVKQLEVTGKKGEIKASITNVHLILENDEALAGAFGYNEFEAREVALRALPWDVKGLRYPRPLKDSDDANLRMYLEGAYGISGKGIIEDALKIVVVGNAFHPVREYLNALEWDGEERLDGLFTTLFGVPDTPYLRAITRKAFTAAVTRIYRDGVKFDHVPTIVGEQGRGKSTVIRLMGGQWFSDSVTTVTGRESVESIQGAWLIELGELSGLRKAEVDAVKHFITKTEDRFRVAYGKRIEYFPRRCVFFATTNEDHFLRDTTGNRRFWVINIKGHEGQVTPAEYLVPEMIAQLWAEAKHRYEQGETLYLDEELEAVAKEVQDEHVEQDERTGIVGDYLVRKLPEDWPKWDLFARRSWLEMPDNSGTVERRVVCLLEIWAEALGKPLEDIRRIDSYDLAKIMRSFDDWVAEIKRQRVPVYGVQMVYVRKKPQSKK